MSEILNDQIDSKESGFSRRRVVKGVAWTVPVILTTAAAPPASASPPPVSLSNGFDGEGLAVAMPEMGSPGQNRTGIGPSGFHIQNDGSQAVSGVLGSIRIEPVPAAAGDPGVGLSALTGAKLIGGVLSPSNVYTAEFSLDDIASKTRAATSLSFNYRGKAKQKRSFRMTITVTHPVTLDPISTSIELD